MNQMKTNTFKTTDLTIASAFLTSQKVKLVSHKKLQNGNTEFEFAPENVCQELFRQFLNNELTASVKELKQNLKLLKDLARGGVFR